MPEYPPESEELRSTPVRAKQRLGWVLSLLVVSVVGLVAQVAQLMALGWDATALVLAISWVSENSSCGWFVRMRLMVNDVCTRHWRYF